MERYIWVKQARAKFADILNTAAYGADRIVIVRRGEELGAFVGVADLNFLRRHKPKSRFPEPTPGNLPPDQIELDLRWRENRLHWDEEYIRRSGGDPATEPDLVEEREYLERLRAWLGGSTASRN
jgi:prevent-host-death family protein